MLPPPPPPAASGSTSSPHTGTCISSDYIHSILGGLYCISQILNQYRRNRNSLSNGKLQTSKRNSSSGQKTLPCGEPDTLLRILELCFYLQQSHSANVSVVMQSLECLAEMFQLDDSLPDEFVRVLTESNAFVTSRIFAGGGCSATRGSSLSVFAQSQSSIASSSVRNLQLDEVCSLLSGGDNILSPVKSFALETKGGGGDIIVETKEEISVETKEEISVETSRSNVETWIEDAFGSQGQQQEQDATPVESVDREEDPPSLLSSDPGSERKSPPPSITSCEPRLSSHPDNPQVLNIGSLLDKDSVSLLFCIRYLTSSYLLPQSGTRVGVQTVTLEVLTHMLTLQPQLLLENLEKDSSEEQKDSTRRILDRLVSFTSHSDPQIKGLCNILISHLVQSLLQQHTTIPSDQFNMAQYVQYFVQGIQDDSATCSRLTLSSLTHCLPSLLLSPSHLPLCSPLLETLLHLSNSNTYWLNQIKLIELMATLPYECLPERYQWAVLSDIVLGLLTNEDVRIRNALCDNLEKLVNAVYPPGETFGCHRNPDRGCHGIENGEDLRCYGNKTEAKSADDDQRNVNGVEHVGSDQIGEVKCVNENNEIEELDETGKESRQVVNMNQDSSTDKGVAVGVDENNINQESSTDKRVAVSVDENKRDIVCDSRNRDDQRISTDVDNQNSTSNVSRVKTNSTNRSSNSLPMKDCDTRTSHCLDYCKLCFVCSRDLSRFSFLRNNLSQCWRRVKLNMFLDMFHSVLKTEVRHLESNHNANFHLICGTIEMLNKLKELFPIEQYGQVWLQSKYIESGNTGLVTLLTKLLFSNHHSNNVDLNFHSSVLNLLVRLLVCVDRTQATVDSKVNVTRMTAHMVKTLSIVANIVNETSKLKTNTLKKNLEKISPIKNFTKDKIQTMSSPKSLHLPVTSFLAQPILSHVTMDLLSPLREDETLSSNQNPSVNEELYSKFYDTVSNSYNNYKNHLKFDTDFSRFLTTILDNLNQVMQVLGHNECKVFVAELSSSLTVVINIEPCATIKCVYYVMKSVFNLDSDKENASVDIGNKHAADKAEKGKTSELSLGSFKNEAPGERPDLPSLNSHSPYDIFEPAVANDTLENRLKENRSLTNETQHTSGTCRKKDSENNKNNVFNQRNCLENFSFFEKCIVDPLETVQKSIESPNLHQKSARDLRSPKSFEKENEKVVNDFRTKYIIKKIKRSKDLPNAAMLSQYLRLFEPCIVALFKHYASTSNITMQVYVLKLHTYIIQLGFNYYNIDPDLAFVQILMKQFELFEHGYVKNSSVILPVIIKFLLTLCLFGVEKSKSNTGTATDKSLLSKKEAKLGSGSSLASGKVQDDTIICINKIIHICDELYASGQNLQQHCIPALKHVVKSVFIDAHQKNFKKESSVGVVTRGQPGVHSDQVELDTQQEVLFINLCKLVHYPEVGFLLRQILPETVTGDVYHRRCCDVYNTLMQHLEFGTLHLDNFTHVENIMCLMDTLSANVYEVDSLLRLLFKLTDFNERNFVSNVSSVVLLLSTLLRLYSLDELFESIVRKKFASFSLDWNTEVDPLHVSITLDATSVQPETELAKLFLYLLYQTVTTYNTMPKPYSLSSTLASELTLNLILIFEHSIEKYSLLKSKLTEIVAEEKRKNNRFFCLEVGEYFHNEHSAVLSAHFRRLMGVLKVSKKDHSLNLLVCDSNDNQATCQGIHGKSVTESSPQTPSSRLKLGRKLTNQETFSEKYKRVLDFLVYLQVNKQIVVNDTIETKLLDLIALQHEVPVHDFLMYHLKTNSKLCLIILELLSSDNTKTDMYRKQLMLNPTVHMVGNCLYFLKTYFKLEEFSEQILLLVSRHFLNLGTHLGFHDSISELLLSCSHYVLSSEKCRVLSLNDITGILNSCLKIKFQSELERPAKENCGLLISALLNIKMKHFGVKSTKSNDVFECGRIENFNSHHWFVHNMRSLCHVPFVEDEDSSKTTNPESDQLTEDDYDECLSKRLSLTNNWESLNDMSEPNLGELLHKLNETEMTSLINHERFNIKLLTPLLRQAKYMLMANKDAKILEVTVVRMFESVKELLKIFPEMKQMYHPVHRFSKEEEVECGDQLDWLFLQNDVFTRCEILLDVVEEYFRTIDELDDYIERQNETLGGVGNKSPSIRSRRSTMMKDTNQSVQKDAKTHVRLDASVQSNDKATVRVEEVVDKVFSATEVINKLKELNKQNSNEMFRLSLVFYNFLSYLLEKRNMFGKHDKVRNAMVIHIVNKILSTNNVLLNKFGFIFNILLKENETDLNNIINSIYATVLYYKDSYLILSKHENLRLTNKDSVVALYQVNTVLQLIIQETEINIQCPIHEENQYNTNENQHSSKETTAKDLGQENKYVYKETGDATLNVTQLFNLTLALCKCDALYTYSRVPFHLWEYVEPVVNINELNLAALPTDMLLSVQNLRDFILRLKYVGWYSRVHFEKTWVILLTILTEISNSNEGEEEDILADKSDLYTLTIQGITELLIQTQLVEPGNRKLDNSKQNQSALQHLNQYQGRYVHSGRNKRRLRSEDFTNEIKKMNSILFGMSQVTGGMVTHCTSMNYELIDNVYNVNQLSYNYLTCLLRDNEMNKDYFHQDENHVTEITNKHYIDHVKKIKLINLDIQSCLHLLIDIYSQLMNNVALRGDIVESMLILSDLFDNHQHYEWMYSKFSSSEFSIGPSSEYTQAISLIGATKSLCFIKLEHQKEKLNGILKKIITTLNSSPGHSTKTTSSELLKLASFKCLFYLLENYVEKNIEIHAEPGDITANVNIGDKIKNSHLLNKTLDLIYNLIKTNVTWTLSNELETNFTALCFYLLETFQAFTPYCNYTPLIETLNIIVNYISLRLRYYLRSPQDSLRANKTMNHLVRLVTMYPKYEHLHKTAMNLCTDVIKKNENHSVDIYSLFVVCVYTRYYTEVTQEDNLEDTIETVDGGINTNEMSRGDFDINASQETSKNESGNFLEDKFGDTSVPEIPTIESSEVVTSKSTERSKNEPSDANAIVVDNVNDSLENTFKEDFFAEDKDAGNVTKDMVTLNVGETSGIPTEQLFQQNKDKEQQEEDEDSFYKMITSKEKSNHIKNFFSDTFNRTEKFKNMRFLNKVKTNFDPLTNMLEKSTFSDKQDSDMDESLNNTEVDHEDSRSETSRHENTAHDVDRKESKQVNIVNMLETKTNKFLSYLETDRESTTTDESEKEFMMTITRKKTAGNNQSTNKTISEDFSNAILNDINDNSFAIIEVVSLFLSRIKQLNQEEIKIISERAISDQEVLSLGKTVKFHIESSISDYENKNINSRTEDSQSLDDIAKEMNVLGEIIQRIFLDFSLESDMLNRVVSEFLTLSKANFVKLNDSNDTINQTTSTNPVQNNHSSDTSNNLTSNSNIGRSSSNLEETSSNPSQDISFRKPSSSKPVDMISSKPGDLISSKPVDLISSKPVFYPNCVAFYNLHIQTKLSHILLHVLKHNQVDLINDWIVSMLSNLFDLSSPHLTQYYLFVFLCFSCTNDLVRSYFVSVRRPNRDLDSCKLVVCTFYNQLNDDLKSKFIGELRNVFVKWREQEDGSDEFKMLFESLFACLGVKC
uniref:Huntingtin n=1 Tax=Cacopsylla melanoneura TaxID=428564 RepID=A0A8D8YB27_9HEMI